MKKKDNQEANLLQPKQNRHSRRQMARVNRKQGTRLVREGSKAEIKDGVKVYHDDSYIDKTKKVVKHGMQYVKDRLEQAKATFDNKPEHIETVRRPLLTKCIVLNKDGKERDYLPDKQPQHKILVHRKVAKVMISDVCMLVRITKNEDKDGNYIDGSWAMTPADVRMIGATDIQHVKRRRWWFFRRYWYEISFDGRVQPASLFYDYAISPIRKRQKLWITREYVPINKTDRFNDYFRFWKTKPSKQ